MTRQIYKKYLNAMPIVETFLWEFAGDSAQRWRVSRNGELGGVRGVGVLQAAVPPATPLYL